MSALSREAGACLVDWQSDEHDARGGAPSWVVRRYRSALIAGLLGAFVCVLLSLLLAPVAFGSPPSSAIRYSYDGLGQLKSVTDPSSTTAVFGWDPVGNLLSIGNQPAGALSLTEVAPNSAPIGASVTLYGTGFDSTAANDSVSFNGTAAAVSSATGSQLVVTVPVGASSGPVSVTTLGGSVTSSTAFTVAPTPTITGVAPAVVNPGDSVNVSGTSFDAAASGDAVLVGQTRADVSSASASSLSILAPTSGSGAVAVDTAGGQASGPDLFIAPTGHVAADVVSTGRMSIGTSRTVSIPTAGKLGLVVFDGTAGQQLSIQTSASTFSTSPSISVENPDRSLLFSGQTSSFMDQFTLPVSGTYTIVVDAATAGSGSIAVQLNDATDATVTVAPTSSGASASLSTTTPGQNMAFKFAGVAGHRVAVKETFPNVTHYFSLRKPDGTALSGPTTVAGSWGSYFLDQTALPVSGTYTVYVDPWNATLMPSTTVTVYDVPADVSGSLSPSSSGSSATVSTSPAQNAVYTFSGTAGQRVSLTTSGSTYANNPNLSILKPDGSTLVSPSATTFVDATTLPTTGTYKIVVDPQGTDSGHLTLTAWDATPASTTLTPTSSGASASLSTTAPGQNMAFTFSGSAGQTIAFKETFGSFNHYVSILKPDGSTLWGPSYVDGGWGSYWADKTTLPVSGTYTIYVDPYASVAPTSSTLTVYAVPSDVTGTLAPSASGSSATVSTSPAQNAVYTFSGTVGQHVSVTTSGSTYPSNPNLSILKPDGSTLVSPSATTFLDATTLPSTGTYKIIVNPQNADSGSLTLTAWDATDATMSVTPSSTGGSASLSTTAPGQNMAFTFSATAGQVIAFKELFPTSVSHWLSILKPDGSTFWGPNYIMGGWGGYWVDKTTLPSTGTYTIYTDPIGAVTAAYDNLMVYAVPPDVTGTITIGGPAQSLTTSPAQNASFTFSASASKTIHLAFSSVTETANWSLKDPSGGTVTNGTINNGSTATVTATLSTAGTYTIVIDPQNDASGGMTLTLTDPPGFTRPIVTETTVPRIYTGAPFLTDFPPGGRALRCAPLRAGGRLGAQGACAHGAAAGHADYRAVSDVLARVVSGGPALEVRTERTGQKADILFAGIAHSNVTLRVERQSAPAYLFIFKPDGRTMVVPRLLGTGSAAVSLRLPQTGSYLAVLIPRRPGESSARLQLLGTHSAITSRVAVSPCRQPAVHAKPRSQGAVVCASSSRRIARRDGSGSRTAVPRVPFHPSGSATWTPTAANLHGDWMTGRQPSPWEKIDPLQAPVGQTALAGQALQLDGMPLGDVTMSITGTAASVRTDRAGRFLLQGLSPGHHVLVIDGSSAHRDGARYGYFAVGVDLSVGQTTRLEYPIWMTQLDPVGDARIDDPTKHDVVLTTPKIPGLEVRVPAGSTIRDHAGHLVRALNITQVPVDRPPFPLPSQIQVPIYFTVQPGGAYLSKGAQIIYPNYTHLPAGQRVDFWNYDPDGRGWYVYGRGTVSSNGKQVIPDPDVRVWELTGAMISSTLAPPSSGPVPGGGPGGGDPVDLGTGLFVYKKTDLVLPDSAVPIVVRRTYRPGDSNAYSFGVGTALDYDMHLWSVTNYTAADLVLPDGGRVHYVRTSPGTGYTDAVYEAQTTPGRFYRSVMTYVSTGGWNLRLQDGTVYHFGDMAPLQAISDRAGNTLTITRSGGTTGNITKLTAPHGRWVKFTYDASNRITQASDNAGRTVSYTYDAGGHLATATDADGHQTSYVYDSNSQMTTVHDARGHDFLTNAYDGNGRVTQQTMADGAVYHFAYTLDASTGKVTQTAVTEPEGAQDLYAFNSDGYETSATRDAQGPAPETMTFARMSGRDLISSVTDPLGHTTSYTLDSYGRPTAITRLAGTADALTTQVSYEPTYGQPTCLTDPLGHTTSYSYDGKGRLTSIQDATGHQTTLTYSNADTVPKTITDPLGKVTTLSYFGGDLSAITDPLGHKTTRFLDAAGRLIAQTDPVGNETRYSYDADNQLTGITDPAGATTSFSRDADGNLLQVQDPRADTITMTYDSLGRMLTRTDGLNRTASYSYDHDGNLVLSTDRRGVTSAYHYDGLDRMTSAGYGASDAQGDAPYQDTVSYTYDTNDELLQAVDSNAGTFGFGYDGLGRMTSSTSPDGPVSYSYDAASRPTGVTANGTLTSYGYDNAGRPSTVTQGSQTASIGYDGDGRRSTVTLPNGIVKSYSYDDASNLTDLQFALGATNVGDLHYSFDPDGHRIAAWGSLARTNIPAPMSSATYDAANERTSRNGRVLLYDAEGNLLSDGTTTFTWDAQGRLASTAGPGINVSYAYDPFGRRIGSTANSQQTRYLWAGANVAQELTGGLTTATMMSTPAVDDLLTRTSASTTSSYLTDPLGSVLALTDPTGAITTSYTYGPFGETTSSGAASANPYQYTGREHDPNGLQYNRARYYNPSAGTFLSEDPAGMAASGNNLYRYTNNDPTDLIDPSGLFGLSDISNAISSVVPSQVSDVASGLWDGVLRDLPDKMLGINSACWGGWHNGGRFAGAVGVGVFGGGLGATMMAENLALSTAAAGAWGGALGGGITGVELQHSPLRIMHGAVLGMTGGMASFGLATLGESGDAMTTAMGNAGGAATGFGFDTAGSLATGGGSEGMSAAPKDGSC